MCKVGMYGLCICYYRYVYYIDVAIITIIMGITTHIGSILLYYIHC